MGLPSAILSLSGLQDPHKHHYAVFFLFAPKCSCKHGISYQKEKPRQVEAVCVGLARDPAGIRTQGPLLKREMLYRLSYGINLLCIFVGASPESDCKSIRLCLEYKI